MAAVLGREFSFEPDGAVGLRSAEPSEALPRTGCWRRLEEATAARVIEEVPRPAGRYQFTHALIHETLGGRALAARWRVRLHARIAQALEALYGSHAERARGRAGLSLRRGRAGAGDREARCAIRWPPASGRWRHAPTRMRRRTFSVGSQRKKASRRMRRPPRCCTAWARSKPRCTCTTRLARHLAAAFDYDSRLSATCSAAWPQVCATQRDTRLMNSWRPSSNVRSNIAPPKVGEHRLAVATMPAILGINCGDRQGARTLLDRACHRPERRRQASRQLRAGRCRANIAWHVLYLVELLTAIVGRSALAGIR